MDASARLTDRERRMIREALEAIWAVLPEDPCRRLGVFDYLADIDYIAKGER